MRFRIYSWKPTGCSFPRGLRTYIGQFMKGQPSGELKTLEAMCSGQYDIIVLDEVTVALRFGLLTVEALVDLINLKPETVELVITGRYAPRQIVERADLVTEMQEVKHYYQNGVGAREGIEQ